jgi:transposase
MMQLTAHMPILVALEPVDFRAGIDGLCRKCRQAFAADPHSGTVFVFRNRRATAIRLLAFDGQGFWLCHKRLSQGRCAHWPGAVGTSTATRQLFAHQLQVLLAGADPEATRAAPQWRPVTPGIAA